MNLLRLLAPLFLSFGLPGAAWSQPAAPEAPARPRNVIVFIADGTGPASFTMAREYVRYKTGRDLLALDAITVGTVQTFSTDSRVTDSAASATAYAAGVKTYNGAISVDTLRQPVATLLEAAEARGMATGLVVTTHVTHATPAAFSAHVPDRGMEDEIAVQQLAQGIDVFFGGGRAFFLPAAAGGSREDGRSLLREAEAAGYQVVLTKEAFSQPLRAPVLGLFAPYNMAYEIDRDPVQEPSLADMTARAIDLLREDPDGFFLLVEGSRNDHAAHENDAAAHLHDVLAYDEAVAVALAFARVDGATLLVATSDHETGGLTLGRAVEGESVYGWEPAVLDAVQVSLEPLTAEIRRRDQAPCDVLQARAGVACTEAERALLEAALAADEGLHSLLSEMVARRAVLGWTTGGHTGVDVPLFAAGPGADRFVGHHDNATVGRTVAGLLGFDLDALTEELRAGGRSR
jgi:alkaline phosphatase